MISVLQDLFHLRMVALLVISVNLVPMVTLLDRRSALAVRLVLLPLKMGVQHVISVL